MEDVKKEELKEKSIEILKSVDAYIEQTDLVLDNKLLFVHLDKSYRVHMPTQLERSKADAFKNKIYMRLINDPEVKRKDQLKIIYKEVQNIDIDILEQSKLALQDELYQIYIDMAITHEGHDEVLIKHKLAVKELKDKYMRLSLQISEYYQPSFECQLEKEYIEYLTFLCTETLVADSPNEQWTKTWPTLEDFNNADSSLTEIALVKLDWLLLNSRGI